MKYLSSLKNAHGNALLIVLVAVLLFAGLSLAVSKTGSNAPNSDQQAAGLQADELLAWASSVKSAVNAMMLTNESSALSLSFEDNRSGQSGAASAATNTQNPKSRGDIDKVFQITGGSDGGVAVWKDFRYLSHSMTPATDLYNHIFNGDHVIDDVGTATGDLAYFLQNIDPALCFEINRRAGLGASDATMPQDLTVSAVHFKGTYGGATLDNVNGKPFGCFKEATSPEEYWFYYVILAQ